MEDILGSKIQATSLLIFPFIQLDLGIGLDNKIAGYFVDITPGLTMFNDTEIFLWSKIDLAAGISEIKPKGEDIQLGVTAMLRITLGYDFIGLFYQLNYHQYKMGAFERYTAGISYKF